MYPYNVKSLHLELTNKCQASCPMCARNYNGGSEREYLQLTEITLEKFKEWFPKEFLLRLDNIYACGNYGDPIIAQDCLEIFEYIRSVNTTTRLAIHTNGSARSIDWWKRLATAMGENSFVVFGIDGFKGQHELYRRGTDFDRIIENARAFMSSGGRARVDSLVFKHNENTVDDFEKFLIEQGFENINFKTTKRFYGSENFKVEKKTGEIDYYLEAATTDRWKQEFKINLDNLRSPSALKKIKESIPIQPECETLKQIYVDCFGNFLPCCWVGFDYVDQHVLDDESSFAFIRNSMAEETKNLLNQIGIPNLNNINAEEILNKENFWKELTDSWTSDNKPLACIKTCSTTLYDTLYTHTVKQQ